MTNAAKSEDPFWVEIDRIAREMIVLGGQLLSRTATNGMRAASQRALANALALDNAVYDRSTTTRVETSRRASV